MKLQQHSSPPQAGVAPLSIESRLVALVRKHLRTSDGTVRLDASLVHDLGADSLDAVELIMAVEEEFGIEIPDEDAENLSTVGDVKRLIIRALVESGRTADLRTESR